MAIGRNIRIYLDDGSISGIRHGEIVNWTGQAIVCPRTQVKSLNYWPEASKPGIYFLFGTSAKSGESSVYIGEAENVLVRLKSHVIEKDFWFQAIFFTSKDENLTKSHVKFLEHRALKLASDAGRYALENGNLPQETCLPRGERDSMEEFLLNLRLLLGVLGHKVLEPPSHLRSDPSTDSLPASSPSNEEDGLLFYFNTKAGSATALRTSEGIVVLKGSMVSGLQRDSLSIGYRKLRETLIETGVLAPVGEHFTLTKDQIFSSPSQAGGIVGGYAVNGRKGWKTASGISLGDIEET